MEQNVDTSASVAPVVENKQKSGNGLKIVTAIACVVAICGIGFGVYGMIQSAQKDSQISDLKTQVEDFNGKITTLETERIETADESGTTANFGFMAENMKNEHYSETPIELISTSYGNNKYSLYPDGKVIVSYDWTRYNDVDLPANQRSEDDLTSRFNGRVVDLAEGHVGNGASSTIFFLQNDGKVAWIHGLELAKDSNQPIAYIENAQDITSLYEDARNMDIAGFAQTKTGEIYAIKPVLENGYVVKYILD